MRPSLSRRPLLRAVLLLALIGSVAALALRVFVGDIYKVTHVSMSPTVYDGERVFVLFDRAPRLERFDLAVVQLPGEENPVVKRAAGLPGETIQIVEGDLLVDRRRLPADAPRPAPIVLFDSEVHELPSFFDRKEAPDGPWTAEAGFWRLRGEAVPERSDLGMMRSRRKLRDGYVGPTCEPVPGVIQVNDGVLELSVRIVEGTGVLRAWLLEEGDTFRLQIHVLGGGRARAVLLRQNGKTLARDPSAEPLYDVLAEEEIDLPYGEWHALAFSNVDNTLRFEIEGRGTVLQVAYAENESYEGIGRFRLGEKNVGIDVAFGGEGIVADFRRIRVSRDLFYLPSPEDAQPVLLGPDEYYFLGDNSRESADSRSWGPVPVERVVGRPLAVVWPPGRARWLHGGRDPDVALAP